MKKKNLSLLEIIKHDLYLKHGTTHKFDCFDANYMGGGTGAEMYGWGFYLAVDEAIALSYAAMTWSGHGKRNLQKLGDIDFKDLGYMRDSPVYHEIPYHINTAQDAITYAEDMIDLLQYEEGFSGKTELWKKFIEDIKEHESTFVNEPMKYVYTVLIEKRKNIDHLNFLNYHGNITSQQLNMLNKYILNKNLNIKLDLNMRGDNVLYQFEQAFGGPKEGSLALLDAGIDGMDCDSFYVIFDDKRIKIINRCVVNDK